MDKPFRDGVGHRRAAAFVFCLALSLSFTGLFYAALSADYLNIYEVVRIVLLFVSTLWLSWGGATVLLGLLYGRSVQPLETDPRSLPAAGTAILMPIYHEDAPEVAARLAAMMDDLRANNATHLFHWHVLSDSRDEEIAAVEEQVVRQLVARYPEQKIFYRRRADNHGRKAGNVAEFVQRCGGAYRYMVVLDADSLMRADTLVHMVGRMEAEPNLGLLQTVPMLVGLKSYFGRSIMFASGMFGRSFAFGLAAMQGECGPFWGHNAIIRTRAFASSCGLPELDDTAAFGGHILSHDSVESVLLARAGWQVECDPRITGSYEAAPENILGYAARDRRWCQGNLQHSRVVGARALKPWGRFSLILGIMSYLSSPVWAAFLLASLFAPLDLPVLQAYTFQNHLPVLGHIPMSAAYEGAALLFGVVALLVLPKTLVVLKEVFLGVENTSRKGILGGFVELISSAVFAPVLMVFQCRSVFEVLMGRDSGWTNAHRDAGRLPLLDCLKSVWWVSVIGAMAIGLSWIGEASLWLWVMPVALPMLLAPFIIWASSYNVGSRAAERLGFVLSSDQEGAAQLLAHVEKYSEDLRV
ncbi:MULTISPECIES: glucans biosynthesis glucosyltransferase MdoH [unclassified Pseudovibrio]|uniref:glucans biosynthesis glucosyltransferase MdoH n=1 Tax=unclassified Pseudovibrio TaxID=2627060 RepID=UPI0007AEBE92|nr:MULTISPECIES: glucans biosynthesis glucosyltransferase MdoH [unclassified Pseudovibrio]KZL00575.1 Glucans biosynthesis glucosyltransferase H [Pseudovibrio sp. W74]KZL06765.1 Glucans biosynthesis glucosyltransferase H [Pseudovibrio sp. Ad14]